MKAEDGKPEADAAGPVVCMVTTIRPGEHFVIDVPGHAGDRRVVVQAVWPSTVQDRLAVYNAALVPGRN